MVCTRPTGQLYDVLLFLALMAAAHDSLLQVLSLLHAGVCELISGGRRWGQQGNARRA